MAYMLLRSVFQLRKEDYMFANWRHITTTIVVCTLLAIMLATPVDADLFHDQILSPAGGVIIINANQSQGYSGTLTFGASNIADGTAVSLLGNAERLPLTGRPPGSNVALYSILLNLYPHYTSQFTTIGPSILALSLPVAVDATKPLSVYETQVIAQPPRSLVWSGPYV